MSIASYNDLVTEVGNYLARDDLAPRVPEFISLFEAKANRVLRCRQMEQRSTTIVDITTTEPAFISLPADYQTMRSVVLKSVQDKPRLQLLADDQINDYRSNIGDLTAQPRYFGIFGSELELVPCPDQNYTLEMIYRGNVPPLTSGNPTNWLITLAPDAYLYGVLLETAPYMKEDPRIQVWGAGLKTALDDLNGLSADASNADKPS